MRLSSAIAPVVVAVVAAAFAVTASLAGFVVRAGPAAAADDVVRTYRKDYVKKDALLREREAILSALVEAGSAEARDGIVWCILRSREMVEAFEKEADKQAARLKPFQDELDEMIRKFAEAEMAAGRPYPEKVPHWPVIDKVNAARADVQFAEKRVAEERALRNVAVDAHGKCVDRMPQPQQDAFRDALKKGPLAAKEWPARAEQYELLRTAAAPWVTQILLEAAANEPDPRALVPALDSLGGRDPKVVLPALVARLGDARWVVRAAALGAIERTPCRESIDAIVALLATETGRLRDDCFRMLEELTDADVPRTPDAWKQWWAGNREAWKGPPPKADPTKPPSAEKLAAKAARQSKKSGFFGIETSSKRLCYVIDVSGSMHAKFTDKSKETRAEMAKQELARSIRALEDGALFAVVMFASDVRVWKPEMTVAGEETRKAAVAWVEASPVVGATNTHGALEAAFQIGEPAKPNPKQPYADAKLDTIILLSDGRPTNGRTIKVDEIRAAVREWNRRRRVAVHTIAFGADADFEFLKGLAADTGGQFSSL